MELEVSEPMSIDCRDDAFMFYFKIELWNNAEAFPDLLQITFYENGLSCANDPNQISRICARDFHRALRTSDARGIRAGKVYLLTCLTETRKNLCHRDAKGALWKSAGKNSAKKSTWKVIL